jgi:hypothetical protein
MSNSASKFFGVLLTLGLTAMAIGFLLGMMDQVRGMNGPIPAIAIVAGAAIFAVMLRGPVGRAIARMLEGHSAPDDQLALRVEQLEAQLLDSRDAIDRVVELEERVDFAERMLAERQRAVLPQHRTPV